MLKMNGMNPRADLVEMPGQRSTTTGGPGELIAKGEKTVIREVYFPH